MEQNENFETVLMKDQRNFGITALLLFQRLKKEQT
jgi:hypothetical protein